jgi:hypothetical protein|tara:strand:- start:143 stop:511 length:369 start_codon:yes stop_codon:yes gene_type:complete
MKSKIKKELLKIYGLASKPPKLDVKTVKGTIHFQKDKPLLDNNVMFPENNLPRSTVHSLRREINIILRSKRCAWCADSKEKVEKSLKNKSYIKEYEISALCGKCQDDTFVEPKPTMKQGVLI